MTEPTTIATDAIARIESGAEDFRAELLTTKTEGEPEHVRDELAMDYADHIATDLLTAHGMTDVEALASWREDVWMGSDEQQRVTDALTARAQHLADED